MKRLWLFSMAAGLLLSSARPPHPVGVDPVETAALWEDAVAPAPGAPEMLIEPEPLLDSAPAALAFSDPADRPALAELTEEEATAPESAEAAPAPVPEPRPESRPAPTPSGVRVVVSIPLQKAYVFADGELLATSPVSTGKRGHETPSGTFPILQKKVHHRSSKYDNAPMPYMQRLTNYGIALHAGSLPGYPASHGCIRLPRSFAKKLYELTDYGTKVTITRQRPKSAEEALNLA